MHVGLLKDVVSVSTILVVVFPLNKNVTKDVDSRHKTVRKREMQKNSRKEREGKYKHHRLVLCCLASFARLIILQRLFRNERARSRFYTAFCLNIYICIHRVACACARIRSLPANEVSATSKAIR